MGMYYNTAFWPQYIDLITVKDVLPKIKNFISKEKADLLHSVQLNTAVELAARELDIPHLMNIYQLRKEEFIFRHMDIFPQYHSCDSLFYCALWSGETGMETRCIRPAAPLDQMIERKKENQSLRILMLGSICGYKNQLAAIRAVEICHQNNKGITLTIAGEDGSAYAQICKNYVKKNGLSDVVKMVGFLNNVESVLHTHDCLLCTSTWESFPSSIVEAMTYDLTIISTPVAGAFDKWKKCVYYFRIPC